MQKTGTDLRNRIVARTLSGRDEDNRRFTPYSPMYRRIKGSSLVNLRLSGRMHDDLTVLRASRTGFLIGYRSQRSEQIALDHESGKGRLPVRRHLGVPITWVR